MFETQMSRSKASSGEIGLNIRTHASPKVGRDQVSRGLSIRHVTPVANALWNPCAIMYKFNFSKVWAPAVHLYFKSETYGIIEAL